MVKHIQGNAVLFAAQIVDRDHDLLRAIKQGVVDGINRDCDLSLERGDRDWQRDFATGAGFCAVTDQQSDSHSLIEGRCDFANGDSGRIRSVIFRDLSLRNRHRYGFQLLQGAVDIQSGTGRNSTKQSWQPVCTAVKSLNNGLVGS